ncbi:hypothetical protein BBD40_23615 [Paenibacillus ihbetae]|uniref:AB hydrolase-1 domain-containing protein n=1 Tax=Paenibacillus ihbetae TaxID=1870820 RepID=A0ABX3JRY4_9BACL|nr:hypothetical protein BBD40_23615 [Paenibacillus ihbetae]
MLTNLTVKERLNLNVKAYDTGEIMLSYMEGGDPSARPLLLLHGGSSRWQSFSSLIPDLIGKFHLYALDLRGHGRSGRASSPLGYRMEDYLSDVINLIRYIIKEPPVIFGHSLGGMIALMAGASYPASVNSIVVGDAPLSSDVLKVHTDRQREMTERWRQVAENGTISDIIFELQHMHISSPEQKEPVPAKDVFGENHPWFEFMAISLSQNDPKMLFSINYHFDEIYQAYSGIDLAAIECPVLFLQADPEQGGLLSDKDVKKATELVRHSQVVRLNGIGHALHMQDKDLVSKAIQEFIRQMDHSF